MDVTDLYNRMEAEQEREEDKQLYGRADYEEFQFKNKEYYKVEKEMRQSEFQSPSKDYKLRTD